MSVKLLTEHYLEFLSLKGGCTGSSESTLFKMPHIVGNHMSRRLILCLTTADIGDQVFVGSSRVNMSCGV